MLGQGLDGASFADDTQGHCLGSLHPHSQTWANGASSMTPGGRWEASLPLRLRSPAVLSSTSVSSGGDVGEQVPGHHFFLA